METQSRSVCDLFGLEQRLMAISWYYRLRGQPRPQPGLTCALHLPHACHYRFASKLNDSVPEITFLLTLATRRCLLLTPACACRNIDSAGVLTAAGRIGAEAMIDRRRVSLLAYAEGPICQLERTASRAASTRTLILKTIAKHSRMWLDLSHLSSS